MFEPSTRHNVRGMPVIAFFFFKVVPFLPPSLRTGWRYASSRKCADGNPFEKNCAVFRAVRSSVPYRYNCIPDWHRIPHRHPSQHLAHRARGGATHGGAARRQLHESARGLKLCCSWVAEDRLQAPFGSTEKKMKKRLKNSFGLTWRGTQNCFSRQEDFTQPTAEGVEDTFSL